MFTIVVKNDGEANVVQLTYDNLFREIKDIPDAQLLVADHWFDVIDQIKNKYVCFVEADCLVNSGYFASQIGLFKKNPYFRKLAMLSSSVAVNDWANRFYGYSLGNNYTEGVIPSKAKKSSRVYPVQIGYVPGAIIRVSMLKTALAEMKASNSWEKDLVYLSTMLSLAFWSQGDGNRVHINPNTTYVSTETYINDIGHFPHEGAKLVDMFRKESI